MDDYEWRFRRPAPSLREGFDEMYPGRRRRRRRAWAAAMAAMVASCGTAAWHSEPMSSAAAAKEVRALLLAQASSVAESLSELLHRRC